MVNFELDAKNPVQLSPAQVARLAALASMPDSQIDYSDIPASALDTHWQRVRNLTSAANKAQVTLRLDADVLSYFKSTGKRYQSRINAALRTYAGLNNPPRTAYAD